MAGVPSPCGPPGPGPRGPPPPPGPAGPPGPGPQCGPPGPGPQYGPPGPAPYGGPGPAGPGPYQRPMGSAGVGPGMRPPGPPYPNQVPMASATTVTPGPGPAPIRPGFGPPVATTTVTYGGPPPPPAGFGPPVPMATATTVQGAVPPPRVPMATATVQTRPPPEVPMATAVAVVSVQEGRGPSKEKVPVPVEAPRPAPVTIEARKVVREVPVEAVTTVTRHYEPPAAPATPVTRYEPQTVSVRHVNEAPVSAAAGIPTQILPQPQERPPSRVVSKEAPVEVNAAMATAEVSAALLNQGSTFLHFRTDLATVTELRRTPTLSSEPEVFLPSQVTENELVELLEVTSLDGVGFGKVKTKAGYEGWLQLKHLRAVPRSSLCWHQRTTDSCEATILKNAPGQQGPAVVQASKEPTVKNGDIVEVLKFAEAGDFAEVMRYNKPEVRGWLQTAHLQFPSGGGPVPVGTAFQTMPRPPATHKVS